MSGLHFPACRGPGSTMPAQRWWRGRVTPGGGARHLVLNLQRPWAPQCPAVRANLGWGRVRPRLRFPAGPSGLAESQPPPIPGSSPHVPQAANALSRLQHSSSHRTPHPAASGSSHPVPALKVTFLPTQPQQPTRNRVPGLIWGGPGWGPQRWRNTRARARARAEEIPLLPGTTRLDSGA